MVRLTPTLAAILVLAGPRLAHASGLGELHVHASDRSATLLVELVGCDGDETLALSVRGPGDADFRPAHELVAYEADAAAGVLFDLAPQTIYELRVELDDPDGVDGDALIATMVTTAPSFVVPFGLDYYWVGPSGSDQAAGTMEAPFATIEHALALAQPGTTITLLPGDYGAVDASGLAGTAELPIMIVGSGNPRPRIDAGGAATAFDLTGSSHVIVSHLEITGAGDDAGGSGVRLHSGSHLTVHDCFVHDNGHWEILVSKGAEYEGGALAGGYHRILDSEIADLEHETCAGASNEACVGQSYYGINLDNNPGANVLIAGNTIHGVVDGVSICGNESEARELPAQTSGVLAQTGGAQGWTNWGVEVRGNEIYDTRDDAVEADGLCVGARVWHNDLHEAENPVSIAPIAPGPIFLVRNLIHGSWGQAAFKMNTNGGVDSQSRNVFAYHNTAVRADAGTLVNLWYALEGEHSVPIHRYVFRNNVFATPGGQCTNALNAGSEHPSFDGDLWYTTDTAGLFEWWDGANQSYDDLAAFSAATGEEQNGQFVEPLLGGDFVPLAGSPAIDQALALPGINDAFVGVGPDVGAFELEGGDDVGESGETGDTSDTAGTADDDNAGESGGDTADYGDEVSDFTDTDIDDPEQEGESGCSCSSDADTPAWLLAFGLFALALRRRREPRA